LCSYAYLVNRLNSKKTRPAESKLLIEELFCHAETLEQKLVAAEGAIRAKDQQVKEMEDKGEGGSLILAEG
jgi:hypothetical protein